VLKTGKKLRSKTGTIQRTQNYLCHVFIGNVPNPFWAANYSRMNVSVIGEHLGKSHWHNDSFFEAKQALSRAVAGH
jgi:hypothetical protein